MSNKQMRTKVDELLSYGMSKQQVFDLVVVEFPEVKPGKVAEHVRYRPTLWARERYRTAHLGLLALIVCSAVWRVIAAVMEHGVKLDQASAYVALVPIASILVGYVIHQWHGQVFEWVGWGNVLSAFGLFKGFRTLFEDGADHGVLALKVMAVAIGALSLYLARKVFAKPMQQKDPMGQAPPHYVFAAEGM
jgi:hypothetical protein